MDKYLEYLNTEIEKAAREFEEAKAHAIKELQEMTVFTAVNYGAGYAAKIDMVSEHAAKLYALNHAFKFYQYMQKGEKNGTF